MAAIECMNYLINTPYLLSPITIDTIVKIVSVVFRFALVLTQ